MRGRERQRVTDAARTLAQLDVGAMPICAEDNQLKEITDRDITVNVVAAGNDPAQTTAGELAQDVSITVGVDDSADDVMRVMAGNQIRRVPVLYNDKNLVEIVSQADIATHAGVQETSQVVGEISKD